jgi:hypothetical protein
MMEELTTPEGVTEGGNVFITAAGSYLDAIFDGLLGIEILEPGCARLRVAPNVPADWKNYKATVPLPQGELSLVQADGNLHIRVTDPRVKVIEAGDDVIVDGATRAALSVPQPLALTDWSAPKPVAIPGPKPRTAALFFDKDFPSSDLQGLPQRCISTDELAHIDTTGIDALVIAGNALPHKTMASLGIQPALSRFIDRGGALVFYGATMHDRGTMGEHSGVIDWYEQRRAVKYEPLKDWMFRASQDKPGVPREKERGMVEKWFKPELSDSGWSSITVPAVWEDHLKSDYDGWGWYRVHFSLPAMASGTPVILNLGRIDDEDWIYVNGMLAGLTKGWQTPRRYLLTPNDSSYAALRFGGDNVLAVQVLDGGGGGGLFIDPPRVGMETKDITWLPIDPSNGLTADEPVRFGVVSWGKGDFFQSWETSRGVFGFKIEGNGVEFVDLLSGLGKLEVPVQEAFTDFAISKPWRFHPLAFTETQRKLLFPDHGERYPCMARIVNTQTGGELILIPASIARTTAGPEILKRLRIGVQHPQRPNRSKE